MPQRLKPQLLDSMAENSISQLSASVAENPTVCLHGSQSTFQLPGRPQLLNIMVLTHLSTPWSELNFNCLLTWPKSTPNSSTPWQRTQFSMTQWQTQLSACLVPVNSKLTVQCQPSNWLFKISEASLPGMTSFTLQSHFLSGVYNSNCDCHILWTRARNCTQCYAPELRAE